jgi:hypothetical protein
MVLILLRPESCWTAPLYPKPRWLGHSILFGIRKQMSPQTARPCAARPSGHLVGLYDGAFDRSATIVTAPFSALTGTPPYYFGYYGQPISLPRPITRREITRRRRQLTSSDRGAAAKLANGARRHGAPGDARDCPGANEIRNQVLLPRWNSSINSSHPPVHLSHRLFLAVNPSAAQAALWSRESGSYLTPRWRKQSGANSSL